MPILTRWGLSADADLVFRALLLDGPESVPSVSGSLGISRRRAAAAVEELHGTHLVSANRAKPGGEVGWAPCTPQHAVAVLRRRQFVCFDRWEQMRRYVALTTSLDLPTRLQASASAVRHLPTAQVRDRIAELVSVESDEHLAMQPEQEFTAAAAAAALPLDKALLGRGVRMRIVGRPTADGDRSCAAAEALSELGGDYRESEDVPVKLMVFDRHVALLAAGPRAEHGALEIVDPALVDRVVALFTRSWCGAQDPRAKGVPQIMLTGREQAIIQALAEGLTDAQVATRINVSPRTVGYALRALMDQLHVDNRFQLGLVLGAAAAASIPDGPEGREGLAPREESTL